MDRAVEAFQQHTAVAEQHRLAVLRFRELRSAYEAGVAERELWRVAREAAALDRMLVRATIREYVQRLRDEGASPEHALIAVRLRVGHSMTGTPPAPSLETDTLQHDASEWVIAAYFEAA
jgi:hypothetical protein